nr:hypothetical protein [Tanacetum cinerariifolium]
MKILPKSTSNSSTVGTNVGVSTPIPTKSDSLPHTHTQRSSYARALIKVRADVELKDNIMVAMPKLAGEGFYKCNDECPKNIDSDVVKMMKKPCQTPRGVPGRSSYARALIKVRADVELKDNIMVAMPKLAGEGFYKCNDECPKNIDSDVVKMMKKPCQTPRGVPKDAEPTIELSNSNPFDVLNSVENDVDLGTNGGAPNLASRKTNSSGSLSSNVKSSSTSNTPLVEKINKIKRLIIEANVTFVDNKGKPLANVDFSGDHDSEDEVASVDNDMANFLASKKDGYGTNNLLEQ